MDDPVVSRAHCAFVDTGAGHRLKDLGSSSGTFVDDARVVDHALVDGDVVVLGRHTLRYMQTRPDVAWGHASRKEAPASGQAPWDEEEETERVGIEAIAETQVATPSQITRMRDALEVRQTPRIAWSLDDGPRSFVLPDGRGAFVVGFGRGMDARLPGFSLKSREVFKIVAYGDEAEVVVLSSKDEVRVAGRRVLERRPLKFGEVVETAGVKFRFLAGDTRRPSES